MVQWRVDLRDLHVDGVPGATEDHTLREGLFLDLLRRGFDPVGARRQLETAIDWGRYAELYDDDADDAEFELDPGAEAAL
ncbi:AAA-associated domain-containing protein [Kitasatospora sp. NPDC001225]